MKALTYARILGTLTINSPPGDSSIVPSVTQSFARGTIVSLLAAE